MNDVDFDRLTDLIGIPLGVILIGLLLVLDVRRVHGIRTNRALVVGSVVVSLALLTVFVLRVQHLSAA